MKDQIEQKADELFEKHCLQQMPGYADIMYYENAMPAIREAILFGQVIKAEEMREKIEDYFDGLVHISSPRLTKEKLLKSLSDNN